MQLSIVNLHKPSFLWQQEQASAFCYNNPSKKITLLAGGYMKTLRTIALFTVIALSFSHALPSYKKLNRRQQQQQALHTAEHLQHINQEPTSRFEQRHPHTRTCLSERQRTLLTLFTLMLLVPTAMVLNPFSTNQAPSLLHVAPYADGLGDETFGPCETLVDGSKFCCGIQPNYTVECCVYPAPTPERDRCIPTAPDQCTLRVDGLAGLLTEAKTSLCGSFDLGGQTNIEVIADAFHEAKEFCHNRIDSHQIADESAVALAQLNALNVHYYAGVKACTSRCRLTLIEISRTNAIPSLIARIERLAEIFNLREMPRIFIYSNEPCDAFCRNNAQFIQFNIKSASGAQKHIQGIALPFYSLFSYSDEELTDMLAHEVHHIKQQECTGSADSAISIMTGNNREAEADMGAVLARKNPCHTFVLWEQHNDHFYVPYITKENAHQILGTHLYPKSVDRFGMSLLIWKRYELFCEKIIPDFLSRQEL